MKAGINVGCFALLLCGSSLSYGQGSDSFPPVTDAMLQDPAPSDWLMRRRTLDSWGYSPLAEVNRDNVNQLQMVWTRDLAGGTAEVTPLAYDGVLYVPQDADVIEAIDALTGDLIWEYSRDHPEDLYDYTGGNGRNNRNIAIFENLIINTSDDGFVFALDAQTGETVWETQVSDYKVNTSTHSSGPIIADGRVISGRSCRSKPAYPGGGPEACFIAAHDAHTGAELWRRRLVAAPGEPGGDTWGDVPFEQRQHIGIVDACQLRPGAEADYLRHFCDLSRTEILSRWRRGGSSVSQQYSSARGRDRRDTLVLPAPQ